MDSIYVLQKKYDPSTVKIGSTQNFFNRMMHYITAEKDFDNTTHAIWLFTIKQSKYNCYQLDYIIRIMSTQHSTPYQKYNNTSGTAFYYFDSIDNLCEFLDKINVKYDLKQIDVDSVKKNIDYDNYQSKYFLTFYDDLKQQKEVSISELELNDIIGMIKTKNLNR
jgi:hypothetical protein